MFFKKKDKELNKPVSIKKSPSSKNTDSSKDSNSSEELRKPLVDTSFVFFDDK